MARPPAFKLYYGDLPTMHASNDLDHLIRIAKRHGGILGRCYLIKNARGNVVWEGENCGKIE